MKHHDDDEYFSTFVYYLVVLPVLNGKGGRSNTREIKNEKLAAMADCSLAPLST